MTGTAIARGDKDRIEEQDGGHFTGKVGLQFRLARL